MCGRFVPSFKADERGAVAPLYALALIGLVSIAGVGFDYGRLMAMDTELQNAADQAALAAATQLDGRPGAVQRAVDAAEDYMAAGTYANETRIANDGKGRTVGGLSFKFYQSYDNDAPGTLLAQNTSSDSKARIVEVTVNGREVFYALTPIVDAIKSGAITASAMAGVQSATCQVPPLMICAPSADFPTSADIGKGVLMEPGPNVGAWAPGVYGYLDILGGGANGLKALLGSNGFQNACISNDGTVEAKPGNTASAPNALNTRFDIYPNASGYSCQSNGDFCPVANTRKDLARTETYTWSYKKNDPKPVTTASCSKTAVSSPNGGGPNAANPTIVVGPMTQSTSVALQGFPRDTCHYGGGCASAKYGDGTWDRTGYLNATHASELSSYANLTTRYQIYEKEKTLGSAGGTNGVTVSSVLGAETCNGNGNNCSITRTNTCAYPEPLNYPAYAAEKDRRVMTVAAVDCASSAGGSKTFPVIRWVDIFLVEPSLDRAVSSGHTVGTGKDQIYGEVIGSAERPGGGFGFQYYGRNKVVLIR